VKDLLTKRTVTMRRTAYEQMFRCAQHDNNN
jgi:hypothetical protein